MKMEMLTKLAVRWLIRQLRKDKDYWCGWQSNIAMIISDNMDKYLPLRTHKIIIRATRGELTGALAGGYCSVTNSGKTIDPVLIEAMVNELLSLNKNRESSDPLNEGYLPTQREFCNICANDFLKLLTLT